MKPDETVEADVMLARLGLPLVRYVQYGSDPGPVIHAILCNDLKRAIVALHQDDWHRLAGTAAFILTKVPRRARGSSRKVEAYMAERRVNPLAPGSWRPGGLEVEGD